MRWSSFASVFALLFALVSCKERAPSARSTPTSETEPQPSTEPRADTRIDAVLAPSRPRIDDQRDDLDDVYADMVSIPEGWLHSEETRFWMYSFHIDRTEVTVGQYRACVTAGACRPPSAHGADLDGEHDCAAFVAATWSQSDREQHPIACIDAADAYAYCVQRGKRLPTGTEWRRAARGDDRRRYPWGDTPPTCDQLAFRIRDRGKVRCKSPRSRAVGTSTMDVSPFGVLDMAGNVSEFVLEQGMSELPLVHDTRWPTIGGGIETLNELEVGTGGYYFSSPGVGVRCAAGGKPL